MNYFERLRKTITKEDFLNSNIVNEVCVMSNNLIKDKDCINYKDCKECWSNAIIKNQIEFKDSTDQKPLEFVKALKGIRNYCIEHKTPFGCEGCKLDDNGMCMIGLVVDKDGGLIFDIDSIEELEEQITAPREIIYSIEHCINGKLYDFVSEEQLEVNDIVCCSTAKGVTYGRIKKIRKDINKNYKECWEA